MQTRKIRLVLQQTRSVTDAGNLEGADDETLVVSAAVWDKVVQLAQCGGWRVPGRQLKCRSISRPEVVNFARALRDALAATPGPRDRYSTTSGLRAFFGLAPNKRALSRILDFVEQRGDLTVED